MESATSSLRREMLDEDLQIVRVTLATLTPEIERYSKKSSRALLSAVRNIDQARAAFAQETRRPRAVASRPATHGKTEALDDSVLGPRLETPLATVS